MRILVVSDIHANLVALNAVIQDASPFDRVWCLGDIVGYGPEPNACIERLSAFEGAFLAGNHDLAVLDKVTLDDFSPDARDAIYWTREQLTAAHCDWLDRLSSMMVLGELGVTLVHGSPRDPIWEYVVTPADAANALNSIATPICLVGHSHVQTTFRLPTYGLGVVKEAPTVNKPISLTLDRLVINPGSVGQPRDDDVRAAYALVDLQAMTLTYRRIQYDISATQKSMKLARLPDRLVRRLRFGE